MLYGCYIKYCKYDTRVIMNIFKSMLNVNHKCFIEENVSCFFNDYNWLWTHCNWQWTYPLYENTRTFALLVLNWTWQCLSCTWQLTYPYFCTVHTVLDNGHIHCLYDRIYTWQWTYPFYIILKSGHIKNFYTAGYLTVNLSIVCFHCLYTWQWTYPLFVLLYSWQWSYPLS